VGGGGKITKGTGGRLDRLLFLSPGDVKITVNAEMNGKSKMMGFMVFVVKQILP